MTRLSPILLYALTLLGGTYLAFRPTFDSGFANMQADPGDTPLNHYILEHSFLSLTKSDYCGTMLSPPFYFPQPMVLGYSENLLGVAPPYWALRAVLPYDLAYQWWMILMVALDFAAFALVARWMGCPHVVAAFGGFLWSFGLVHVAHLGHQQMLARFWCPFVVYYAWEFVAGPNMRAWHRMLACVVLQTATCVNTGWFLGLGLVQFFPMAIVLRHGGWRELKAFYAKKKARLLLSSLTWGAALVLMMLPFLLVNRGHARVYGDWGPFVPNASCWLTGPKGSCWFETIGEYRDDDVFSENALFSGLGLPLLAVLAVFALKRGSHTWPLVASCVITAICLMLLTLDFGHGATGWWGLRLLPGGGAIRAVSRVYVPVYLFLDMAIVLALSALLTNYGRKWIHGLMYAAMAFIIFEQIGPEPESFPKTDFYGQADDCAKILVGADAGFVAVGYEYETRNRFQINILGMWAGLKANIPMVNGYSGRTPDGYNVPIVNGYFGHAPDGDAGPYVLADKELRAWLAPRFHGKLRIVRAKPPHAARDIDFSDPRH